LSLFYVSLAPSQYVFIIFFCASHPGRGLCWLPSFYIFLLRVVTCIIKQRKKHELKSVNHRSMTNQKMISPKRLKISEEKFSYSWSLLRSSTPFMSPSDVIEAPCLMARLVTVLGAQTNRDRNKMEGEASPSINSPLSPLVRHHDLLHKTVLRPREIKTRQTTLRPIIIMENDLLFFGRDYNLSSSSSSSTCAPARTIRKAKLDGKEKKGKEMF
jgi:hypothetical protein